MSMDMLVYFAQFGRLNSLVSWPVSPFKTGEAKKC